MIYFNYEVNVESFLNMGFDEVVLVIGINLCKLIIEGYEYWKVMSYLDVFCDYKLVGKKVVIIGVGGIGFDVVEFLVEYEYLV